MKLFSWRLNSSTNINIIAEDIEEARIHYYKNNTYNQHFNLNNKEPEIYEGPCFFIVKNPVCPECGGPGTDAHPCPFEEDVNNDDKKLCNCCITCENNCARDI